MFKCEKCNYETNRKQNFERHKNRITPCNSANDKKYTCNFCNTSFFNSSSLKRHSLKCKGVDSLTCPICEEKFQYPVAKYRHIRRNNCKAKTYNVTDKKYVVENQNITNIQNIHNTQNINQNITINCFGNEDLTYLLEDSNIIQKLNHFGKSGVYGFPKILSDIHFNKNKPENNTIIKPDEYGNGVMIKNEDNEWEFREFEDIREDLIKTIVKYFKAYNIVKNKLGIRIMESKERKILKDFGYQLMLLNGNIPKELFDELEIEEENLESNHDDEIKGNSRKFDKSTMKTLHSKTSQIYTKNNGNLIKKIMNV